MSDRRSFWNISTVCLRCSKHKTVSLKEQGIYFQRILHNIVYVSVFHNVCVNPFDDFELTDTFAGR